MNIGFKRVQEGSRRFKKVLGQTKRPKGRAQEGSRGCRVFSGCKGTKTTFFMQIYNYYYITLPIIRATSPLRYMVLTS